MNVMLYITLLKHFFIKWFLLTIVFQRLWTRVFFVIKYLCFLLSSATPNITKIIIHTSESSDTVENVNTVSIAGTGSFVYQLGGGGVGYWSHQADGRSVGELLCLKLLPQFSSYLNETCYTWSLWREDVQGIYCMWGSAKGFQVHAPILKLLYKMYIQYRESLWFLFVVSTIFNEGAYLT